MRTLSSSLHHFLHKTAQVALTDIIGIPVKTASGNDDVNHYRKVCVFWSLLRSYIFPSTLKLEYLCVGSEGKMSCSQPMLTKVQALRTFVQIILDA